MRSFFPSFILAYHGCDKGVGEKILAGKSKLLPSTNDYDWLGNGVYFWEANPSRALEFARHLKLHPGRAKHPIKTPFVIGAVVDLGNCFNLLESEYLEILQQGFELVESTCTANDLPLPQNTDPVGQEKDLLLRRLDCAVIESVHTFYRDKEKPPFDTTRGLFREGNPIYPNSGFHEKNHIQVCVRDASCIKGVFRVLDQG